MCVCVYDLPTVSLTVVRRPTYYIINVLIPCLMLCVLVLCNFFLPPDSGEKVSLGITVLLAFTVFQLLIAELIPTSAVGTPILGTSLLYRTAVGTPILGTSAVSAFSAVVRCPEVVSGCTCVRVLVCSTGVVRNELICGSANVVHTSGSFRTHTHARTHARMHACTHTHTHTHTHTRTHARTHTHTHM